MKPRDPMDTLKRAFPGLRWRRLPASDWFDYLGKGPVFDIRVKSWPDIPLWELRVLFLRQIVIDNRRDRSLSRLCARTAERLWRIASACESAQTHPLPKLAARTLASRRSVDGSPLF